MRNRVPTFFEIPFPVAFNRFIVKVIFSPVESAQFSGTFIVAQSIDLGTPEPQLVHVTGVGLKPFRLLGSSALSLRGRAVASAMLRNGNTAVTVSSKAGLGTIMFSKRVPG